MRFKSIRLKLFLSVISLVLIFISISLFLNNTLFKKFYINNKKEQLIDSANEIMEHYQSSRNGVLLDFEILEKNRGLHITIYDKQWNLIYDSYDNRVINFEPRNPNQNNPNRVTEDKPQSQKRVPVNLLRNLTFDEYRFLERTDARLQNHFIDLAKRLNNGDILVITVPVALIDESVAISNQFLLFGGLIILIIGIIISFFFSQRFTKPIIELDNIAKEMAGLNFESKYETKRIDEIGELGGSINSLSEQLSCSISNLKESNEKLQIELEKERKLDEMRKEFVSSVSHELKTPISLIQGYSEGLIDNVVSDEKSRKFYAEVIVDEAKKMDRHVSDLLDLNRLESGLYKLDIKRFDIVQLIKTIVTKYDKEFLELGISCNFDQANKIFVEGDSERIEQVIQNYINNAIDHLDKDKMISIKTEILPDNVRISVINSGSQINKELLDSIWKSYFKADKARTRSKGGTGLGLSIVKAIILRHNGEYGVDNLDSGVSFWFELKRV